MRWRLIFRRIRRKGLIYWRSCGSRQRWSERIFELKLNEPESAVFAKPLRMQRTGWFVEGLGVLSTS